VKYAARLYAEGSITLERAAMDAGISRREMRGYLKQRKIPTQYDIEDLEEDMKKLLQKDRKIAGKQTLDLNIVRYLLDFRLNAFTKNHL